MLSNKYFYHKLTRKYVILFGNMFNNISLVRKNTETNAEIERFKIPIIYAPKEKYYARLQSDPDLARELQISLPRLSFEMVGINYDPSRKQNSLLKTAAASSSTAMASQYMGVPYNLDFELNLYTRNIDDGTHIIEQILPYFNPDYTSTVNLIPEIGFLKDVPIILNSVTNNIEHEGNFDAIRFVTWTLRFTMKANYYGPVSDQGIIRKIDTNIYNDPSIKAGYIIRINTNQGNSGTFKIDDLVYQGSNYQTATAYAKVVSWNSANGRLVIGSSQGQFYTNNKIRAVSTNAAYNIASFDASALKLVNIHIEPKPNTAEPDDDYGYDITITEWPDTE
jgi:hypothetical protein